MPADSIHEYFVDAEANLEKGATALAQAGVDPGTVDAVSNMAAACRKIIKALGKGQEQTADNAPPAPPAQPAPGQPHTMESATASLHNDMQASAGR